MFQAQVALCLDYDQDKTPVSENHSLEEVFTTLTNLSEVSPENVVKS